MLAFAKALFKRYATDDISSKAAALAYFTVFSLGPLLFIVFGILGLIAQNETYKAKILADLDSSFGSQTAALINKILNAEYLAGKTGPAFTIGIIGLVLGAIGIFGQLQKSLNDILHVKVGPTAGLRAVVKQKLLSLSLVGIVCFLLLVSLVASTTITLLTNQINEEAISGPLSLLLDFIISVVILATLLTLLYRTLPAVKLPWKVLYMASLGVAVLFALGKIVLGLIIGQNTTVTAFGTAGSLIALLLWIFYSGQIIYLGAAGINIYVQKHNLVMKPRYGGSKGVVKLRLVEEPLNFSLLRTLKKKFTRGIKKGWNKK